jgi:hypothetical protein
VWSSPEEATRGEEQSYIGEWILAKSEEDGAHIEFKEVTDGSWSSIGSHPEFKEPAVRGAKEQGWVARKLDGEVRRWGCAVALVAGGAAGDGMVLHAGCDAVGKEEGGEARRLISFFFQKPPSG